MRIVLAILFSLCLSLVAVPAYAHPHAWIIMNATMQFNKAGLIEGVALEWRFDEQYSRDSIKGLDVNKDGYFSPAELQILAKENLAALEEYSYFVYTHVDGKKLKYATVTEYSQYRSNDLLTMSFTIPFKKPIDPRKSKVVLKAYDPTFFIAMDFQKTNPVSAIGPIPKQCKIVLKPVPSDVETMETKNLLATKPKDWQPEAEEEFGALFAQPVIVSCS